MSTKSKNSHVASGAVNGATQGAVAGSAILPGWGTAIGAVGGGLLGGISGYLADDAENEAMKNDPEYQAAQRREKSRKLFSASLGHAFAAMKAPSLGSGTSVSARLGAGLGVSGGI